MTLNKAPINIPIDFPRSLSLNNDENFKLIIKLIANEFDSKKESFKNFKTEREFLSSQELKEFIANIKQYIVCWRIRPENLGWLDEYLKSLLVEHWRSLSKESKSIKLIDDNIDENTENSGPIPVEYEVNSTPAETNYSPQHASTNCSKFRTSLFHTRVGFTIEQVNFRLIWTDPSGMKTSFLEIPATLCLVDARAISSQAQSYSWKIFINTFQKLINDENDISVQLNQGFITYVHPENKMKAIENQIQFSVALNHMACNLQGCVGKFFFCGNKEVNIDSTKEENGSKIVHHAATNSGGKKFPHNPSLSHVYMLRRKTLKARRLKAASSGNPYYSRSGLYRSVSKARKFNSSQKLARFCS